MQAEQIRGRIMYEAGRAAFLREEEQESLLAMDVPPFGNIQEDDIAAAFNHFAVFQGVRDGDPVSFFGIRDRFGGRPLILIVRMVQDL